MADEAAQLFEEGTAALRRLEYAEAREAFTKARPLYQQVGSVLGEANCILCLGDIALARSDYDTARSAFEEARPLYRQIGDVRGEANCIVRLGDIAMARSDHDTARRAFEEARPLYDTARRAFEEARPLYHQIGDMHGEAYCILGLGEIALARPDHDKARRAFEEARPLYQQVGSVLGEATCILGLGETALACSDHDTARVAFEEARPLYHQIGDMHGEANCIFRLATSRRDVKQALRLYQKVGSALGEANCKNILKAKGREGDVSTSASAVIIPFPIRSRGSNIGSAPPSGPADTLRQGRMRDDFNTKVKKAKAENLARGKPRPKRRSSRHQLANYRALVENVDLENPALSPDERLTRANRLLTAYGRVQAVKAGFRDSNIELTAARRIQKAAHRERQRALANGGAVVALG